jgi:hypothetical protein
MAEAGLLLLVHGEVTDAEVDMFDREAVFIETKLVRRTRLGGCGASDSLEAAGAASAALCRLSGA